MTTRRVEPAAVGAAVAGALGAWCATGALTIDGAATRLGALPPLWLLAIFGITSLLAVVGTRATARDAAPLWCPLISVLPWLPVPLPAAAALWVGPLGQILAATAFVAVLARRRVPLDRITTARPIPAVIVLASLFLAAAWWLSPRIPGGDEPHYLVISQSLLEDGDLRIEDNHQRRDYAAYVEGELRPDYLRRGKDGAIYSVHAPGLPALVAPAFLAGGYPGVVAMLALLSALGVLAAWRAALEITGDPIAATVGAAGVGLSAPFFFQAFTVYPDGPAAVGVGVVVGAALARRGGLTWQRAAACGAILATLPWLHTRYAAIACVLGAVVVLRAIWPLGEARTLGARLSAAVALMLPAALSAAAWFWSFHAIYGTFDPRAPYGHATDMRLARIPHGLAGLFFDQQFGLLPNAPLYLIALLGLGALWRRNRRLTCELVAIATPYLLAVAGFHMWWGGRSSPARFLVPVLLPFAMPIAAWWALHSTRAARASALALLGVTLGITAALVLVDRGALVYNSRDGHSLWLLAAATAVNLTYALPSLFQAAPAPASVTGVAWLAALAGGGILLRWLDERGVADGVFRAATLATTALVCSAGATLGWWTSERPAADPGAGTIAVLSRGCDRSAIGVQTWPFRVTSSSSLAAGRPIPDASRRPRRDVTQWAASDLPPGRYHFRIDSGINVTGRATVALGRPDAPIAACDFDDRPSQTATCPVWLPAGASALFVEGDERLRRTATGVALVFDGAEPGAPCATHALRAIGTGGLTLFVTSGRAWTESGGLWTAGGSEVGLVAATDDELPIRLRLRQGAAGGDVAIRAGGWSDRRTLEAGQAWDVEIPRRARGRSMAFTVSTTSSFQPAAHDPASRDLRVLGVWIEMSQLSD